MNYLNILTPLIHITNASLAIRVVLLYWYGGQQEISYIADAWLITLLSLALIFNLLRWHLVFRREQEVTYISGTTLKSAMRVAAETAYMKFFFLPRLIPNDSALEKKAFAVIEKEGVIAVSPLEIFLMVLNVDKLVAMNMLVALVSLAFLGLGGLPSYARVLSTIPFVVPAFVCLAAHFAISSVATLIFYALSQTVKGK